jgi:hypothetical protein
MPSALSRHCFAPPRRGSFYCGTLIQINAAARRGWKIFKLGIEHQTAGGTSRILEVKMTSTEEKEAERKRSAEREAERKQSAQRALKRERREATVKRIKEIIWSAVIASVITIIVLTSLGWLTTQRVVETAREQGAKELVSLRASICTVKFQQRPDASAKIAEFKALSYGERDTAVKKFVTEEKLATMLGEDAPAPGAIDKCADAISDLSR